MAKRSISDAEIALIKGMLARGMKNKDIQFYFNRPDRAVNSGRVSQIKTGSYGPEVPPAPEEAVSKFVRENRKSKIDLENDIENPIDAKLLESMFVIGANNVWHLKFGETDRHECKENFGVKHGGEWIRAIAALSNNRGGYLFFGVRDKLTENDASDRYAVVGLKNDVFINADPSEIAKQIKSYLDPTPKIQITTINIGMRQVGVMYIEQHPSRPVIVRTGDGKNLKEGDIFFRYPGCSERVKYSDLRAMLDERDAAARSALIPMIERVLSLGPDRTMIADLENQVIGDASRPIFIDKPLAEKLKFIKEGSFSEKDGATALRLVGDVRINSNNPDETKTVRINITPDSMLLNFLKSEPVQEPIHYILNSASSTREWLPIWYYLKLGGLSAIDVTERLKQEAPSRPGHTKAIIDRLEGRKSAHYINRGTPQAILAKIYNNSFKIPSNEKEARQFALAIQGLNGQSYNIKKIRDALISCYNIAKSSSKKSNIFSSLFKAACRLDELLYMGQAEE